MISMPLFGMAKTRFQIPLNLTNINIQEIKINEIGEFHIYVSCTARNCECYKCGKEITKSHGHCKETIIEHLPIFDNKVFIHVKWPRFICDNCDDHPTTSFHPEWLGENGECTRDYEKYILKCLINSTIKDIAEKNRTTEERIEGIIDRCISLEIDCDLRKITRIGVDEIALKKGHNHYLTIVSDISIPGKTRLLKVISGRSQEEILPFFQSVPRYIWTNVESISTDMGASFLSTLMKVLGEELYNEKVTIDRFHVAKLINGNVDDERKKNYNKLKKELKDDDEALEKIKHTMWPFRHHYENLEKENLKRLKALFEQSPDLKECYNMREDLYRIFEINQTIESAKIMIDAWCLMALQYKETDNPFESFVKTYYKNEINILNYFSKRHSSGPVEGLNNKIKVIKRRGFGFDNVINFAKRLVLDINLKEIYIPKFA